MRLIVFDCDGTLVDSQKSIMRGIETAWQSLGKSPPKLSEVLKIIGLPLKQAIETLCPLATAPEVDKMCKAYMDTFKTNEVKSDEEMLYTHVIETLNILNNKDTILAIITGKSKKGLDKVIERQGFKKLFSITKSADCGPGKPNPKVLFDVIDEAAVEINNVVMIGDTTFDIEMGKNANVKTIGVSFGYHTIAELNGVGADIVVDKFSEIPNAIDSLLNKDNG